MAGIGTSLSVEAVDPPAGRRRSTPMALHKALTKGLVRSIRRKNGDFGRYTTGDYLGEEVYDSYDEGRWWATDTRLDWSFKDHGGCCSGSAQACYHWLILALDGRRESLDKMAAARGWRITTRKASTVALSLATTYPMMRTASGEVVCLPALSLGETEYESASLGAFFDEGGPRMDIAGFGLRANEALRVALSGRCRCGTCSSTLFSALPTAEVLVEAWMRLGKSSELQTLCRTLKRAILADPEWDLARPDIAQQQLSAAVELPGDALVGMACRIAHLTRYEVD